MFKFLGWILIILVILGFIGFNNNLKESNKKLTFKNSIGFILVLLIGLFMAFHSNDNSSETREPSHSKTEKVSKKSNSSNSSKKKSSKEDKKVKSAQKANDQRNFDDYKNALTTLPDQSNGALTKAFIDSDSGNTVLVLSDDASALSSNELKSVCKSAWDLGIKMSSSYMPGDNSVGDASKYITIEDNTGNKLAHTSLFGSFKYNGE